MKTMNDSRVLDPPVGKKEPRSNRSDALEPGPADHLAEPAGIDDLGVIVEEQQEVLLDHCSRAVVDRREVEDSVRTGDSKYAMWQHGEILQGRPIVALVVNDVDSIVTIGGYPQ